MTDTPSTRSIALLVALVVALAALPGLAAADSRVGGAVVVAEGETVDGLDTLAGSVVVRGTVDGDLNAASGDVFVAESGEVTGSVNVAAGNVRIAGSVGGDLNAAGGSVALAETATVGGDFEVGAGDVAVFGSVAGDAVIGADTILLGETATIDGDLRYDGDLTNEGATVGGSVVRDESIGGGPTVGADVPDFGVLGAVYGTLVNLLLGAVLLLVLPAFSRRVTDRALDDTARSGLWGLVALFAVPLALVLLALTIVGIPLSLVGAVLLGVLAWVAAVYGRIAVGTWLTRAADVDSRWAALVVGVLAVGLLAAVPLVGWLVEFVVVVVGLGAFAISLNDVRKDREAGGEEEEEPSESGARPA